MENGRNIKLDLTSLQESCRRLSLSVLWSQRNHSSDIVETMTNRFVDACVRYSEYIQSQGRDPNMLTRAVLYVDHTHAIPPLGTDISWFHSMLSCLIELAVPNTDQDAESKKFLDDVAVGIAEFRD